MGYLKYLLWVVAGVLSGCGGGGGGGSAGDGTDGTASGYFKDTNVSGLEYVSGNRVGVTGPDGHFIYEKGQAVAFSIGGVTLGSAKGAKVVTPVELAGASNLSSRRVQNMVRFLIMLDKDGNPQNGIEITPEVRAIANNWPAVDFDSPDLGAELVNIRSDAASVDGRVHALPDAQAAMAHLRGTLRCTYAGVFAGMTSEEPPRNFGVLVSALTGDVRFLTASANTLVSINSTDPIVNDRDFRFAGETAPDGATGGGTGDTQSPTATGDGQNGSTNMDSSHCSASSTNGSGSSCSSSSSSSTGGGNAGSATSGATAGTGGGDSSTGGAGGASGGGNDNATDSGGQPAVGTVKSDSSHCSSSSTDGSGSSCSSSSQVSVGAKTVPAGIRRVEGRFPSTESVSGALYEVPGSGSVPFSGHRIGGDVTAEYRYAAFYEGSVSGLLAFDIDTSGKVTGAAYHLVDDTVDRLEGVLEDGELRVTTTAGIIITGSLNLAVGHVSGTWEDAQKAREGRFSGDGCKLN